MDHMSFKTCTLYVIDLEYTPIKTIPTKYVFRQRRYGFEANFQNLYLNIRITYSAIIDCSLFFSLCFIHAGCSHGVGRALYQHQNGRDMTGPGDPEFKSQSYD